MAERDPKLAIGAVAIVVLAAAGTWLSERPPAPLAADAPAGAFAAERAVAELREIAARPHVTGSAEHARIRQWLVARLGQLGFEVEVQEAMPLRTRGRTVEAATVRNVVARKRGAASTGGVALVAHYDSRELAPGAGDDGAGVAAIIEAARALTTGEALRNDLYVIITDAEEPGLFGASALVDGHPWWEEITLLLNFEARGSSGPSAMFETNPGNGWIVREVARADPYPATSSLYYEVYQRLPNGTDFNVFKGTGVYGLNFGFVEGADAYHRPIDTVEHLSPSSLQHHGEHALALVRHFGSIDLAAATRSADVVFFTVPVLGLVVYSAAWASALAIGALLLVALIVWRAAAAHRLGPGGIAAGVGAVAGAGVLAAGLSFAMLVLVRIVHHEDGSIVGRLLYDETWYGLAVVAIAAGSIATLLVALRRRFDLPGLATGALLIGVVLALAAAWLVPGVSMLFVWPAIFGLLQLAWILTRPAGHRCGYRDLAVIGLLSVPIVVVWFPLPYAIFIGLNISSAAVLAVVVVLGLSWLTALFEFANLGSWRAPALGFVAALAFVGVGLATAGPGPQRPVPVSLNYVLDRDAGNAFWVTTALGEWPWLEQFVGPGSGQADLGDFGLASLGTARIAAAPQIPAPPVEARVIADRLEQGRRRLRVELRSALGSESIRIFPAEAQTVTLLAVNAMPVVWPGGSSDRTDWVLSHRGVPQGGVITLELGTASPDQTVELIVLERGMSLPTIEGKDMRRPPDLVAHAGEISDTSTFRQRISLGPADDPGRP